MMMKNALITVAFIAISNAWLTAQNNKSCCAMHASSAFAFFSQDEKFKSAHMEPEIRPFKEDIGEMISFKCADGKQGRAFQILTPYNTNKYLLVFHEWWGLNTQIKEEAVKLFKALYDWNVIALDLYDGKTTTSREEAAALMQNLDSKRATAIILGLLKKIGKNAKIATIGWCMGGGWSLQAAIIGGNQTLACVMYYGFPEKDVEKLKKLQSDVLFINALQDEWISKEVVNEFKNNMKAAAKKIEVLNYDAPHAFANPSNPGYHQAYTEDAMKKVIKYLQKAGKNY
jgi:carboxymethylenebutenolidase